MRIRQVASTVAVAPPDAYGTPTTFYAGQLLDIAPCGAWEQAIGAANVPVLSGSALNSAQTGSGPAGTDN